MPGFWGFKTADTLGFIQGYMGNCQNYGPFLGPY